MKTLKKTFFWLIAILISLGYWKLTYSALPLITKYPEYSSPLLFSLLNIALVLFMSWLVLKSVVRYTKEKTLLSTWRYEKFEIVFAVILVMAIVSLVAFFLPSALALDQDKLIFDYSLCLVIPSDLLFIFLSYVMFRWWIRINKTQVVEKKQVVLDEVKKPLPKKEETKNSSSKNAIGRKKILFLGIQGGPKDIYDSLCEELRKEHEVSFMTSNPSHLTSYDVVILHGKPNLSKDILDSLWKRPKIIVISNTKENLKQWKNNPDQKQLVFVLGKDKIISSFVYALFNTLKFKN